MRKKTIKALTLSLFFLKLKLLFLLNFQELKSEALLKLEIATILKIEKSGCFSLFIFKNILKRRSVY